MKIAAGIEYLGSYYYGWQFQKGFHSVQEVIEQAFSKVANQPIRVICAGRTDRGVHALGQVIHFDTEIVRSEYSWLCGVNTYLPQDIRVVWIKFTSEKFHARNSALARRYQYLIYNASIRPAIGKELLTWHFIKLDVERMKQSAQHLLGTHDFSAFRAIYCQARSPIKTIQHLKISEKKNLIIIDIQADGFLHHMVRNIAGVLMKIGEAKAEVDWPLKLLADRDRIQAGMTAPPQGLSLVEIIYPTEFNLPKFRDNPYFFL